MTNAAEVDPVEQALSDVRHVKAELHSRISTVLGTLPGPAESAAHQRRCRPAPNPVTGIEREMKFDVETVARAAKLNPESLRKAKPRMGRRILPLGITGAYFIEALGKKELLVVHIVDDTPAADVIQIDDIIIGANGRLFEDPEDPRPEMGNALAESQSTELGGILTLHVVRDREPMNLKIDLGNKLSYSDTWPHNCEKSKQIREAALEYVLARYPWDRRNFWTPTFLMASGDDRALELARRHLFADVQDDLPEGRGANTWRQSYRLINMCEYYLITGDSSVLPAIRYDAECISWAQYRSGSWSHGGGGEKATAPGMCDGGYGEINCAGLGAFIGLCLARQCGIEPYEEILPKSIRFFGEFCGANFPYGLGKPGKSGGRMDNGMNSMAAIGFHLLGEDAMADRWARTVCCMWMARERGHAEAIFSAAWGPVGASLASGDEFHAFMNHMKWAYELGRTGDGELVFMRGGRWDNANATAAMGLFLYLPEKRLQILGGDSVFARHVPEGLEQAAMLYHDKKWKELESFLSDYLATLPDDANPEMKRYAQDLLAAYRRLEKQAAATMKIIDQSIRDGKLATAKVQLDLLKKMLGEERPEAAKLRSLLGEEPLKDPKQDKFEPRVDCNQLAKDLQLTTGGMDNGFAHSPDYITRTNRQGFEGMPPEQIAGFLSHPSGSVSSGASLALSELGESVVPLMKRLLEDEHPGIRSGALGVLANIYRSDSEEYSTEVPPELVDMIRLAQPLTKDSSPWVRNAATGLLLSMKIVNEDIHVVLREMAKLEGNKIANCVRYGIKDPQLRIELCMELTNTNNRAKSKVPYDYKPINWGVPAHLDLCDPYVQTAVDTINNPEVLMLYGFFSQGPPNMALTILSTYSDDPLVLKHLPEVLRFGARKREEINHYWVPCYEYPHRIVIKLGPAALPVVGGFYRSERALYRQIAAGQIEQPVWWKEDSLEHLETWITDLETTCEIVRCMHGLRPADQAAKKLCDIYLGNREWGTWERQQIRDHFTRIGIPVVAQLKQTTATGDGTPRTVLLQQIEAKQIEIEGIAHRNDKRKPQAELDKMVEVKQRYDELADLAAVIEAMSADRPDKADIETLCRFYLKRPWGEEYPFTKSESSYMRAFDQTQLELIRNTLEDWGAAALPAMKAYLSADRPQLEATLKQLEEDRIYWEGERARLRGLPLARIEREVGDIQDIRAELNDLITVIECAARNHISSAQIEQLCLIYTRRGWTKQNRQIETILKQTNAAPTIRKHIEAELLTLPEIRLEIETAMPKVSSTPTRWRYNRAMTLQSNIKEGIAGLERILENK